MEEITPEELHGQMASSTDEMVLLDVREPFEFEICHINGSINIPMNEVPARIDDLDADARYIVICHHGGRSMQVAMFLQRNGFAEVCNLEGGVDAWARTVDPDMPTY